MLSQVARGIGLKQGTVCSGSISSTFTGIPKVLIQVNLYWGRGMVGKKMSGRC